jgi:hypothetical protein
MAHEPTVFSALSVVHHGFHGLDGTKRIAFLSSGPGFYTRDQGYFFGHAVLCIVVWHFLQLSVASFAPAQCLQVREWVESMWGCAEGIAGYVFGRPGPSHYTFPEPA